eukprot:15139182-Alexandrium_andersonii.AAC.1
MSASLVGSEMCIRDRLGTGESRRTRNLSAKSQVCTMGGSDYCRSRASEGAVVATRACCDRGGQAPPSDG